MIIPTKTTVTARIEGLCETLNRCFTDTIFSVNKYKTNVGIYYNSTVLNTFNQKHSQLLPLALCAFYFNYVDKIMNEVTKT